MASIIKIEGTATFDPSPYDGTYVREYDPSGNDGRGSLSVTSDRASAKQYADAGAALQEWRSVSKTHPLRPDGRPNRPLTAFTVSIEQA